MACQIFNGFVTNSLITWAGHMPTDELFRKLTDLLGQQGDRTQKARAIAEAIRAAGAYRWTGIYDVDLQTGLVVNIAWSGPRAPVHPTFPIMQGLTSRAITTKKTVNIGDVASDPNYLTALQTTRSEIIVPVLDAAGERVLGTIDVESERPNAFDSVAQERLEQCAEVLQPLLVEP